MLAIIPTFILITLLIYCILDLSPSDPVALIIGPNGTIEQIEAVREQLGLNDPMLARYVRYMINFFQGDMGKSWVTGTSVFKEFQARIPNTLILAGMALSWTIIIGIPLGIIAAVNNNSIADRITMVSTLIIISLPDFFLGLLAQIYFCLKLKWFPVQGVGTYRHFILPSIILSATRIAGQVRLTRSSMLDVLSQDYVRTAKSKGNSSFRVIMHHAFRNGVLPVITSIGNNIGMLCAGAVTVESVFAIPGIGSMLVSGVRTYDIPVVMGPSIFVSLLVCVVSLLIDIAYAIVDPRIRLQFSK